MALTIITYGGGEVLEKVFSSIAMLFNKEGQGVIHSMMMITCAISSCYAVSKALFSHSFVPLLSKYFLPLIILSCFLFIPTSSVHIEDLMALESGGNGIKSKVYKVDHVPALLAKFAECISSIGYQLTTAIESIMHLPNDVNYNASGMIFGGETALETKQYQLTNGVLEQNLRRFSKQCVLYDISLGKYSIDNIKKTADLWAFLEKNTSNVRMLNYSHPENKESRYLTCRQAIQAMTPYFEKEKKYYAKNDILGNLPLTFQALTGLVREKEQLIGQQLMMNLLTNEYGSHRFTNQRASDHQQSTMQVAGALSAKFLISMRNVIEAIIYAGFIFVIPLSMLPNGINIITKWAGLLVWIQMWPPLYSIINYMVQIHSQECSAGIFSTLSSDQQGLSFFTNLGLRQLQNNMLAASGFLYTLVPMLSYALLKGGEYMISNVTSSMASPTHQAASNAASEQTTGNYSYANASLGQFSYQNVNGFQKNLSPSLASGYFTDSQGSSTAIYSSGENILKQNNSDLRTGIAVDQLISQSVQKNEQQAKSLVNTTQQNYLESLAAHSKIGADLTDHMASMCNYSEGLSEREGYQIQESAAYLQNEAANWGKQYGLNAKESLEALLNVSAGGGIPFLSGSAGGSYHFGSDKTEMLHSAKSITEGGSFQKSLQAIQDFAKSKNFNVLQDEGNRYAQSFSHAIDQLTSSQTAYQYAESYSDQVSQNATWLKQNGHSIRQSLNQDFVNWGQQRFANEGGFSKVEEILSKGQEADKIGLADEFVQDLKKNHLTAYAHLWDQNDLKSIPQFTHEKATQFYEDRNKDLMQKGFEGQRWELSERENSLEETNRQIKQNSNEDIQTIQDRISQHQNAHEVEFINKENKLLLDRSTKFAFPAVRQLIEKPFWMKEEN